MVTVYLTEEQLIEVANKSGVEIYRNAGRVSDEELRLLSIYPHYFWHFVENNSIDIAIENPDYEKLKSFTIPLFLKGAASITDEQYRSNLKRKIYNLIINNDVFKSLIHRYVEDFVLPNKRKQDYVDSIKAGKNGLKPENNHMPPINIYKNIGDYNPEYQDFLLP